MATRHERFADKTLNDKHSKILKALMQRADNRKCADCRKKDPRWASWNLGIFVCIRCSGIHRSMGTHISKVKSADLDSWTPEQVENMVKWGNGKANWYWEHDLPKGLEPQEHSIDAWIRGKYEKKQYAKKSGIPDPSTIPLPEGVEDIEIGSSGKVTVAKIAQVPSIPPPSSNISSTNVSVSTPSPQLASSKTTSSDLFEAFQSAPAVPQASIPALTSPTQSQTPPPPTNNMKASIMSLYGSSKPNAGVSSPQQPIGSTFSPPQQPAPLIQPQGAQFFGNISSTPPPQQQQQQSQPQAGFANFADFSAFAQPSAPTISTNPNMNLVASPPLIPSGGFTTNFPPLVSSSTNPTSVFGFGGNGQTTTTTGGGAVGGIHDFMSFSSGSGTSENNNSAFAAFGNVSAANMTAAAALPAKNGEKSSSFDDWGVFQ